jgi:thymidine phosphorylase
VKFGKGAFCKEREDAEVLALKMVNQVVINYKKKNYFKSVIII